MTHKPKMMWACVAVVSLVVILAASGLGGASLLFVVPCMLMIGAMMWMMLAGRASRDGHS